eukprot:832317-Amphidinium_carterae.1
MALLFAFTLWLPNIDEHSAHYLLVHFLFAGASHFESHVVTACCLQSSDTKLALETTALTCTKARIVNEFHHGKSLQARQLRHLMCTIQRARLLMI